MAAEWHHWHPWMLCCHCLSSSAHPITSFCHICCLGISFCDFTLGGIEPSRSQQGKGIYMTYTPFHSCCHRLPQHSHPPHSYYLAPTEQSSLLINQQGHFSGQSKESVLNRPFHSLRQYFPPFQLIFLLHCEQEIPILSILLYFEPVTCQSGLNYIFGFVLGPLFYITSLPSDSFYDSLLVIRYIQALGRLSGSCIVYPMCFSVPKPSLVILAILLLAIIYSHGQSQ